jgi:hypothetical protein
METEATIQPIREILDYARSQAEPDEITLRHALNEGWFSAALAWLLDPRGSHGVGDAFLKDFVKTIAKERSAPRSGYARRVSLLKWGNAGGRGQYTSKLRLGNACSIQEYYLSAAATKRKGRKSRSADVVVFDLDPKDGLFLVIENKLFGKNHKNQLLDELQLVEERYLSIPIREYVYLTLSGDRPVATTEDERKILNRWVCLSWTGHVLDILEAHAKNPDPRLSELIGLLRWLRALVEATAPRTRDVRRLERAFVKAGVDCLLEQLNHLGQGRVGEWRLNSTSDRSAILVHTGAPRRTLSISMLTACSLVVQSKYRKRARCDKLLVPFGAPLDQTQRLLEITARDVYWIHFDKPHSFFSRRRKPLRWGPKARSSKPLLEFIRKHHFELGALLCVSRSQST